MHFNFPTGINKVLLIYLLILDFDMFFKCALILPLSPAPEWNILGFNLGL